MVDLRFYVGVAGFFLGAGRTLPINPRQSQWSDRFRLGAGFPFIES